MPKVLLSVYVCCTVYLSTVQPYTFFLVDLFQYLIAVCVFL